MKVRRVFLTILWLYTIGLTMCHGGGFSLYNLAKSNRHGGTLQNIIDYARLKVGQHSKQSYWHYSGVLRNPLTGREIVGIEGVEVVRSVPEFKSNTSATSFLAKKIFMYVDKANASSLVEQYRLQRQAPLRPVKGVKEIIEKVTLGVNDDGQSYASITWPGSRRTITNNRIIIEPVATSNLFFSRMVGRKKLNVVNFMSAGVPVRKIPRHSLRRWISFSPSQDDRAGRSQEYYTISNTDTGFGGSVPTATVANTGDALVKKPIQKWSHKPEAVLTYQRHGEGPAWYAVGRACIVELTGARYASEKQLPSYIRELVQRVNPTFFDLTVPAKQDTIADANSEDKGLIGVAVQGTAVGSSKKQTLLTPEWFDAQKDPADKYKPWYSHIHSCIAALRKR